MASCLYNYSGTALNKDLKKNTNIILKLLICRLLMRDTAAKNYPKNHYVHSISSVQWDPDVHRGREGVSAVAPSGK